MIPPRPLMQKSLLLWTISVSTALLMAFNRPFSVVRMVGAFHHQPAHLFHRRFSSLALQRQRRTPSSSTLPLAFRRQHKKNFVRWLSSSSDDSSTIKGSSKKRIVFLGTPDVAAATLQTIVEHSMRQQDDENKETAFEVVAVVTQPARRAKRTLEGDAIGGTPVGKIAQQYNISILCPEKATDVTFLETLEQTVRPDLCITAAYGNYLPKRFLAIPPLGTVNIHPSLLPKWRGASPVQRSLQAGDNPVGVSVLYTVSKMDAGPILIQQEQYIDEQVDTATTVLPMLFALGTQCLLKVLPDVFRGTMTFSAAAIQNEDEVVQAKLIDSSEGEGRPWNETAREIHNKVRGFSMWPGTSLTLTIGPPDSPKTTSICLKLVSTRYRPEVHKARAPTNVVELGPNKGDGLLVVCYDGSVLEILELIQPHKRPMTARAFVNGIQPPNRFFRWDEPAEEQVDDSRATVAVSAGSPSSAQSTEIP